MPVLEIRNLAKRREQAGNVFELRVPAFVLEQGRFYGIAGKSGSGKSTLLDMLALVMRPTTADSFRIRSAGSGASWEVGELWRRNDELALAGIRRTMCGYVLQSGGLIGFLSVRQNLEIPFQLVGHHPDQARIEAMAERFGVGRELSKKPRHLSGGQRQRVAILRALMLSPPLILADEPTAAVDSERAKQIVAEFRQLALEMGSTIVMVSHDHELLDSVADDVMDLSTTVDGDVATSTASWRPRPEASARRHDRQMT
jgi:putative ABC transport system ATP-binding protein